MAQTLANGTGRRKTSVARVYLRQGSGALHINGYEADRYFDQLKEHVTISRQPLAALAAEEQFDVVINVRGGGKKSQAGAIRQGLARALVAYDESNRPTLRSNGFLTRDDRMVERKKYGQPKARRKFQFSKR